MEGVAASLTTVRVLVVGDDPLVRSGLSGLLSRQEGLQVAAELAPEEELVGALEDARPDAALMDLGLQFTVERVRELDEAGVPVVALIKDGEDAAEAFSAGARGLLPREADGPQLAAALRAVCEGLTVLDDGFARSLISTRPASVGPSEALTRRELEVLQLLSEGLSNKLIGARLAISEHTAKFHVNAILQKLAAGTRTEAVVKAARLGLVLL